MRFIVGDLVLNLVAMVQEVEWYGDTIRMMLIRRAAVRDGYHRKGNVAWNQSETDMSKVNRN